MLNFDLKKGENFQKKFSLTDLIGANLWEFVGALQVFGK
jgi:hypothetical protein